MNDKEYNQIAEKLEKQLNDRNTLIKFKVLSDLEYIMGWKKGFLSEIPLDRFIIRHKIYIENRCLIGWTSLSSEIITDSAIDIVNMVCEQSADGIAKMILAPNASEIPERFELSLPPFFVRDTSVND